MQAYMLISADCHAGVPWNEYLAYLDPQYRDTFKEWTANVEAERRRAAERRGGDLFSQEFKEKFNAEKAAKTGGRLDAGRRVRELEEDGVVGEVIFPDEGEGARAPFDAGLAQTPGAIKPELTLAGARAYNRWLADLCGQSPEGEAGVAIIAIDDIGEAVREIQWARKAGLRGGILIPSMVGDLPHYNHPRYEPIWATAEETGMPVHTHGGGTPNYGELPGSQMVYLTEVAWWAHRPWWFALWSGVFERHPALKFVLTEQWADWVPDTLSHMDTLYGGPMFGQVRKTLSLRPTEYWARQCWVGASFMRRFECERRHAIGVRNIMWGSDYPHLEGTWPHSKRRVRSVFRGVPEAEKRLMLGENAARVYNFDVEKLAPAVQRVGPRADEL